MIPKIIHYCWFGEKAMPDNVKKNIESWKRYNEKYELQMWTEKNFDYTVNLYMKEAHQNKKWAFVTDYVRLKVLYDYGGIYMDTDVEVLKSFDGLLNHKAFSGFEGPNRISTGIMGAEKGNRWIELLLEEYENRAFVLKDGSLDLTTNVKIITDATQKAYPIVLDNTYQDLGDVTIYPFDFFCAKDLKDGRIKITENTITIHHFNGSWMTPKKKIVKFMVNAFGIDFVQGLVRIKKIVRG